MKNRGIRWLTGLFLISLALQDVAAAGAERVFRVEHDHLWKSCAGELTFGATAVTYKADRGEHSAEWKYEDIQQLELGREEITILTYAARRRELGRDQAFRFRILPEATSGVSAGVPTGVPGEMADEALREYLQARLARPLVTNILPAATRSKFSIPARYRRFMGSAQGVLEFADDYLLFRAEKPADSRLWRYDELLSLASTGPFRLRLGVLENTDGEFGAEKPYNFDLKRRLSAAESDFLWEKINRRHLQ